MAAEILNRLGLNKLHSVGLKQSFSRTLFKSGIAQK